MVKIVHAFYNVATCFVKYSYNIGLSMFTSYILNKNYKVVRNAGLACSTNSWKLNL